MKSLIKYINFKKACALLTALSFLFLNINSNLYALTAAPAVNMPFDKLFETTKLVHKEFGQVTNFKDVGSNITVINIQDLHCHLQTQQNINNIITEINNIRPVDTILAEGGYENFNLNWITELKDKKFKEEIIKKLLSDNDITATEYYALTNNKENILKGLDNKILHEENLSRLNFIINNKDIYSKVISRINQEVFILNKKYINQKNRRFSRILNDYHNGKISSVKFYKILFKYINNINKNAEKFNNITPISVNLYPNISKYLNIYSDSAEINPKSVTAQLQSFILMLKNNLPYNTYSKLLSYTDNFSNTFNLADFIKKYSESFNIDLESQYPELNKFITSLNLSEDINPIQLLKEEELLVAQIRMALSYDNTEYEITFISDFFKYFEKYLSYSLTAYDWQYYKENYDKFSNLYSKYSTVNRIQTIEKDFDKINSYYETNNTRNDIFVSNIIDNINMEIKKISYEDRDLTTILKQSDKVIIVVAGGFHSEELKDFLSKEKINTVTITPTVTKNTTEAKILYEQNVKLQDKVLSQALALRMAASATSMEQTILLVQVALEIYGDKDLNKLEEFLDNKIKITKLDNEKYKIHFEDGKEIVVDKKNKNAAEKKEAVSSLIKDSVNLIFETIPSFLPTKGLQSIFVPETYYIFKNLSLQLFNYGIYLSDGVIIDIEKSPYKDKEIDNIQPEIYSTFLPEVQHMLLDKVNPKPLLSLTNKATLKQVLIEELFFRILPMAVSIFNPFIGIPFFALSQFVFTYAHSITVYMRTTKPNKSISLHDYFKQLKDIIFNDEVREDFMTTVFGKSTEDENKTSIQKECMEYMKYIKRGTILLALPYLCAILFSPVSPILIPVIATATTIFSHYVHNINNAQKFSLTYDTEQDVTAKKEDKDIAFILIATFIIDLILVLTSFSNPATILISFLSLIFPINSILTLSWTAIKSKYQRRIFNEEGYESKYFSNVPEENYDYSQGSMDVTIQIPVYTESNEIIFETIRQSMDAVANYKGKQFGAKANVLISDDGLAVLLDGNISREHIEQLLSKPLTSLLEKERQAVERIKFYREHNISFVARPKANRAGLFKKASNLNHTYKTIEKLKKNIPIDDGTYYEGDDLDVYDVILMLDKDSGLHKDILSVSVPKFIKDEKLAYTENVTIPSNRGDNYFSKTIATFTTFLYNYIYPSNALSGGIVPFVGHNGFIRKSALEEIGFWPEDRVSEDYYTSTLFSARGYHGQYLHFKGYEFKEMVSRSFIEEASKMARYTFGLLELILNKNVLKNTKDIKKGILTDWMKEFLFSKDVKWYQKIHFFVYPLSYVNIILAIPTALFVGLILNAGTIYLLLGIGPLASIPFAVALYKMYTKTDLLSNEEKDNKAKIFTTIVKDLAVISFMFISFSHVMATGVFKFFRNPDKAKFSATNVDDDNYTLSISFSKIKDIFKNYKSIFIYVVPFVIKILLVPSSIFDYQNTIIPFVITFAFVFSNIFLNPFFINALKNKIAGLFNGIKRDIKVIYSRYVEEEYGAYPLSIIDTKTKSVRIYITDNTSKYSQEKLVNTGLKIKGATIWQVKEDDKLIFVADDTDFTKIAQTINNSRTLKKQIKKLLNLRNNVNLNIEAALMVDTDSDDTYIEDNILTSTSTNFTSSFAEIIRVFGVVFSQKMMVSLTDIANDNLYQAVSNGSVKKVITGKQFEYLQNKFEQENKDIIQEILTLREKGIELYVISEPNIDDDYYKQFGISGTIKDSEIYDYFSQEKIEIEEIPDNIQIKALEKKIIYSPKPLLIKLNVLQKLFSMQNNILDTYNTFDALLGKIKIKFGFKNITTANIKEFAYNINLSQLPNIDKNQIKTMLDSEIVDFTSNLKIADDNIISVILNDTKIKDENKKIFLNIIKQRMLTKLKLQEENIESVADKKLERLLGQMLLIQYSKTKTKAERETEEERTERDVLNDLTLSNSMNKINELYPKAIEGDIVAVNAIIEIILFMQERRIEQFENKQISTLDYKQMLAAA